MLKLGILPTDGQVKEQLHKEFSDFSDDTTVYDSKAGLKPSVLVSDYSVFLPCSVERAFPSHFTLHLIGVGGGIMKFIERLS